MRQNSLQATLAERNWKRGSGLVDSLARVTSTFKKNHVYQRPCIIIDNLPRTPPQPTLPLLPDPAIFLLLLYLFHTHLHLGNCTVDLLPQERPLRLAPPRLDYPLLHPPPDVPAHSFHPRSATANL